MTTIPDSFLQYACDILGDTDKGFMVKENPITGGTEELVKYSRLVLTVFSTVTDEYVVFFFVHDPHKDFCSYR